MQNATQLRDTLRTLVTEHKLQSIERTLMQRTRYITFAFERFYHEHNIQAAMRSIEGCGFQDVSIIDNEKKITSSVNVTTGADYWLTTHEYAHGDNATQACFDALRGQGYHLVGATPHHKSYTVSELPLDRKVALVFGNERIGLSEYALNHVDTHVTIPMYGFTESFNASASVAIVAYELRKRLQLSDSVWHLTQQEMFDIELTWLKRLVRGAEYIEKNISNS